MFLPSEVIDMEARWLYWGIKQDGRGADGSHVLFGSLVELTADCAKVDCAKQSKGINTAFLCQW